MNLTELVLVCISNASSESDAANNAINVFSTEPGRFGFAMVYALTSAALEVKNCLPVTPNVKVNRHGTD